MSIICNLLDPQADMTVADDFLHHFGLAASEMKKAEAALLDVSGRVPDDVSRRYRKIHKQMARLRREWNCLEHERERATQAVS
jgi:hypothetical protein